MRQENERKQGTKTRNEKKTKTKASKDFKTEEKKTEMSDQEKERNIEAHLGLMLKARQTLERNSK